VEWLGYVPHGEIKHYLAHAHLGVVPGRYTRQYGNPGLTTKLFEYLLMGLPVLSVDYPHRRVYIEKSQCGLTVGAEDVRAHADAILWFSRHPEERNRMGARGQAMVLDHYTWEKEAVRLLQFYDQILR
jgi:glycosyltransferase involved in cell wall biosynthesis